MDKFIGMDLSYQNLKFISQSILALSNIRELFLNNNELTTIPDGISELHALEKLNLSHNKLSNIPAEIGRLYLLKELDLSDNYISTIPMELGNLYNLETISLANNPLISPFNTMQKDRSIIQFCREHNTGYKAPAERAWVDVVLWRKNEENEISVGTYNILTNYYAARASYAPSWVINGEMRKDMIMQNIVSYNVDILCLQEVEPVMYNDFYKPQLEQKMKYESVYNLKVPHVNKDGKNPGHGCAVFWRRDKYRLVDKENVNFLELLQQDSRFCGIHDVMTRNFDKNNIAQLIVLETSNRKKLLVTNNHLYWHADFSDVKLIQAVLMIERIQLFLNRHGKIPVLHLGDFNSLKDSDVYSYIVDGEIEGRAFNLYNYGPLNNGSRHFVDFKDTYESQEITFTNYVPGFKGLIDYIFYTDDLELTSVLSPVEDEYTHRCIGLPSIHFPSDHIFIGAQFRFK